MDRIERPGYRAGNDGRLIPPLTGIGDSCFLPAALTCRISDRASAHGSYRCPANPASAWRYIHDGGRRRNGAKRDGVPEKR
jgi:hypothetical protein